MNPLVSIIVPIYNVEKYLHRCMETLINQTIENIEIIMVDDGSPDNCHQLCDEYAKKDKRIHVIHKENGGLGFARNSGLEIATGEYISFVDSDDYVTEDMCEKLYQAAKRNNADVVYGSIFYDNGFSKRIGKCVDSETIWIGEEKVKNLLLDFIATKPGKSKDTIMEVSVWKAIFRRSIFNEYNIKFESERKFISEDVIFNIDYLYNCKCVVAIPDPVYYYCVNPSSLSKTFRADRFQKVKQLYVEINRRLGRIYELKEYQERCDRFLIARARTNSRAIVHHKNIIGRKEMKKALIMICTDKDLTKILKRYPIIKLPIKQALVAILMKIRLYIVLELVLKY